MELSESEGNTKGNGIPDDIAVTGGSNFRILRAIEAATAYEKPCESLYMVGITGTKGKTTVAYILRDILKSWNIKAGIIGTIGIDYGDRIEKTVNTTPEPALIHKSCRQMLDEGCKVVIMEVSSQGLKQCRTYGIVFDVGVFTNISPDHISAKEHSDFDEYRACKAMLFTQSRIAVVNGDDPYADYMGKSSDKMYKFGRSQKYDFYFDEEKYSIIDGKFSSSFSMHGMVNGRFCFPMPGEYSIYNAVCAMACAHIIMPDKEINQEAFADISVSGRMQVLYSGKFDVISDYAHNGIALDGALAALRPYCANRIICVFGCGGDRDAHRRFEMGKASGENADITIITSDNPRSENPEKIMDDIESGMRQTDGFYFRIADRKSAVRCACCIAKKGDIVLLAGKGHEDYQEINGERKKFLESEIVKEITERRK